MTKRLLIMMWDMLANEAKQRKRRQTIEGKQPEQGAKVLCSF